MKAMCVLLVVCAASCGGAVANDTSDTWDGTNDTSMPEVVDVPEAGVADTVGPDLALDRRAETPDTQTGCPSAVPWPYSGGAWPSFKYVICDQPELICTYPAWQCPPGTKPDNVCECRADTGHFVCEQPFHNCLPLPEDGPGDWVETRPLPASRTSAEECTPPGLPRAEPTCTASKPSPGSQGECQQDSDCDGPASLCLDTGVFGSETTCQCHEVACETDDDCQGGVCHCGVINSATPCGGYYKDSCAHTCLPSSCQTNADCGEGRFCSPSYDICGWHVQGYHCHDAGNVECFNHFECLPGHLCSFQQGGWSCQQIPMCD